MLVVLLPFLCLVVADHAMFTLTGGPQVILGVFQPRAPLACGFVVTSTAVFYFKGRYNFLSRFDVQNYVSDPDRVPASAAMFFGPPDDVKTAFLVIGDNMGELFGTSWTVFILTSRRWSLFLVGVFLRCGVSAPEFAVSADWDSSLFFRVC